MRIGCNVVAMMSVMWWLGVVFVAVFQCQPIAKAWDINLPGHCISYRVLFVDFIAPNIALDVLILCLPLYEVTKLHITTKQSIALCSVFLLGTGVVAAGGIRIYYHIAFAKGSDSDLTSECTLQSLFLPSCGFSS